MPVDEEVEAILTGDDNPLERKVVGLPPLSTTTSPAFTYTSSLFSTPTDEERERWGRGVEAARADAAPPAGDEVGADVGEAMQGTWTPTPSLRAARSFLAFVEDGGSE